VSVNGRHLGKQKLVFDEALGQGAVEGQVDRKEELGKVS
jgi:hypothetical protein